MKRPVFCIAALLPSACLAALLASACGGPKAPETTPPATTSAPALPDWSRLPAPTATKPWRFPSVEPFTLKNGLRVWHFQQDTVPLVVVSLIVPRGAATDPPGKAGLTALMIDLLDEGAGGKSAIELGEAFQRLGTSYSATTATDAVVLGIDALADKLEPSLELLSEILLKPTFLAEEVDRRRQQRSASALAGESDPATARSVVLRRVLFHEGYGGLPADGVRGTIDKLKRDDVLAQHRAVLAPEGASLVMTGALDRATALALAERYFGAFAATPGQTLVRPAALDATPPLPGIHLVDFPGATQSAIATATRSTGIDAPDYYPNLVYNWVLGGSFTSRINLNLREQKGYTYGARSGHNRWRSVGFFSVGALVKVQHTGESLTEIFAELSAADTTRKLTDEERERARSGLLLGYPGRFETLAAITGQVAELAMFDRAPDWHAKWPDQVAAVTVAQVEAMAHEAGKIEPYVIVIAGDRAVVAPQLLALGRTVHLYDAQGNALSP